MKKIKAAGKEEQALAWIEGWREYFLERAYLAETKFHTDFYVQCIESTAADCYEVFFAEGMYNYFRENLRELDEGATMRFYKLAGIHHTIRAVKRRKKELTWEEMKKGLFFIYGLKETERQMAEILFSSMNLCQTAFWDLFLKTTPRYLFGHKVLSAFSFAFIGNFWYNSYSSFMGSFTGYVPFHIRMERAAGQ